MADELSAAVDRLTDDDPAVRRDGAERVVSYSEADSDALIDHVAVITRSLDDDDPVVRRSLARALRNASVSDPASLHPAVGGVVGRLDDEEPQVRDNLLTTLARVASVDPGALRSTLPSVVDRLDDPDERVRESAARVVERLATRYPDDALRHRDAIAAALRDQHAPVRADACRALAALERRRSGALANETQTVADAVDAEEHAVATAACEALGALGTAAARRTLRATVRTSSLPEPVRSAARRALREAQYPDRPLAGRQIDPKDADEATLVPGTWVSFDAFERTPPTGRYRGVVTEEPPSTPVDRASSPVPAPDSTVGVRVRNPYLGYAVDLWIGDSVIRARHEERHRSTPVAFDATDLRLIDDDREPLLHAVEGDTLSFSVEGAAYEVTVTEVRDDETRTLVCEEADRGYVIEFLPLSRDPAVAHFRQGRGFAVTDLDVVTGPE